MFFLSFLFVSMQEFLAYLNEHASWEKTHRYTVTVGDALKAEGHKHVGTVGLCWEVREEEREGGRGLTLSYLAYLLLFLIYKQPRSASLWPIQTSSTRATRFSTLPF